MDIISTRVTVKAKILDDIPRNVGKIEVKMNDNVLYSGTSGDWKGAYNEDTGEFQIALAPLEAGEYTFVIIAIDKANNQAEESIAPLYIYPPGDVRVIGDPLNYPNPFAPLKGEKTAVSYVLTTDADITILIYNIVGSAVWKRNFPAFEEGGKAGYNEVIWNGRSDFSEVLGNGVYFYRIVHKGNIIGKGRCTILD
jgi:hypothetical protein